MTTTIARLESLGRVHFIGIGGGVGGMSAVARIMVSRGVFRSVVRMSRICRSCGTFPWLVRASPWL